MAQDGPENKNNTPSLYEQFSKIVNPEVEKMMSNAVSGETYFELFQKASDSVLKRLNLLKATAGLTSKENQIDPYRIIAANGSKDSSVMGPVEAHVQDTNAFNINLQTEPPTNPEDRQEHLSTQHLAILESNQMIDALLQENDFKLDPLSIDERAAFVSHMLSKPEDQRAMLAKMLVNRDLKTLRGLNPIDAILAGFDPEAQMEDLEVPANIAAGVDGVPDLFTGKVRAAVDTLMLHESGELFPDNPYNAWNRGTTKVKGKTIFLKPKVSGKPIAENNIENLTLTEHIRRNDLGPDEPQRLFAVGKYQIIPKTAEAAFKGLGLSPDTKYSKDVQDAMFEWIINIKRKEIGKYLRGEPDGDRNKAIRAFAAEFASGGIPKDETIRGRFVKKGGGVYGGQNAKTSPETVGKALDVLKEKYQE